MSRKNRELSDQGSHDGIGRKTDEKVDKLYWMSSIGAISWILSSDFADYLELNTLQTWVLEPTAIAVGVTVGYTINKAIESVGSSKAS